MEKEITKEIKNLNEIEEMSTKQEEIKEESNELDDVKQEDNKKDKKPNKKKIWIIVGIIIGILLITVILIIVFTRGKQENSKKKVTKNNDSKFVTLIKKSLKSGEFDQAIKEGLSENDLNTNSVCILRMDLDSDGNKGLMVYVEDNKNVLLQLNTDGAISYEDSFPLDSKESLGYVYSSEKNDNYWYTEFEKNYIIISSAKKIIKEEDFLNSYYIITNTYQQKPILNHCIEYKFDKSLDAKKLEKTTIKIKDLLKDHNLNQEEIKGLYEKYLTEKTEKEKQEKEEAEQKAKEEELKAKLSGSFTLGSVSYQYGSYKIKTAENEEDGIMVLYADGTCTYKEASCKFQIGDVRNEEDELVPGITLNNGKTFISSTNNGELIEPKDKISAQYHG